jgi:hypothetical protein
MLQILAACTKVEKRGTNVIVGYTEYKFFWFKQEGLTLRIRRISARIKSIGKISNTSSIKELYIYLFVWILSEIL